MIRTRILLAALTLALGFSAPRGAEAQAYPNRAIRLILPYTAGSPNDVIARLVAPSLSARLGQSVVVENRPGGGGSIGTKAVAVAEPDGYTLLFASSISHVISVLYSSAPYDPLRDFAPIAPIAVNSWVLVVPPSVAANSIAEFIAYAKANPGRLNFGFGQGTAPHLMGEWFKVKTGVDIASIPYKGGAQAITDMLGGRIQMNVGTTATLVPLIGERKIKPLVVMSPARNPLLPDVPTMIESGHPEVTGSNWTGILAPAGTPKEIVDRLNTEITASVRAPEMQAAIARIGFEPQTATPQAFAAFLEKEAQKWVPIVRQTGVKMD